MIKKLIAPAVIGTVVLGGGAIAFANGLPARPSATGDPTAAAADPAKGEVRTQIKACVTAKAPTDRASRRAAVLECAQQAGVGQGIGKALRKATHAELTLPAASGGYEVVQVDRGKVTAATDSAITLVRADGPTVTVQLSPGTVYRGTVKAAADVKVGDQVVTVAKEGAARTVAEGKHHDKKAAATTPAPSTSIG